MMRVGYQGVPGAYSEKATVALLGRGATPVPFESFESVFQAVQDQVVEAGLVPIENTLGGSIHINYDLLLRYQLQIVAEYDLKVEHCLMALPGVTREQIETVTSHPQALAQCDNFLRTWGVSREACYDTAGSAKLIQENKLETTAAIASDLAAKTYGLHILEHSIEDNHSNYTRFLLLKPGGVSPPAAMPAKTSIVFSLANNVPGALFKAIACFSLRDIDMTKLESRPGLINISGTGATGVPSTGASTSPSRASFQYMFYLDFLANCSQPNVQCALGHLREVAPFVRTLGCYPCGGLLVHDLQQPLDSLPQAVPLAAAPAAAATAAAVQSVDAMYATRQGLSIAIVGFGNFGQFLARSFARSGVHRVFATSRTDYSETAQRLGVTFRRSFDALVDAAAAVQGGQGVIDVVILAPSILSFEKVVQSLVDTDKGKQALAAALVVDVLSVKVHPKMVMQTLLPRSSDILCTHPMFGPESGKNGWHNLPFVYEQVRIHPASRWRCDEFVALFRNEGCKMVNMTCETHDELAAGSQFLTHFTGRALSRMQVFDTPINTKGYESLLTLVDNTSKDSFDLFLALYKFNTASTQQLDRFSSVVQQLAQELHDARNGGRADVGTPGNAASAATLASSSPTGPAVDLSPRVLAMQGSATVKLHTLSQELKAQGRDVVMLNVGEPDFPPPEPALVAAERGLRNGHTLYTEVRGALDLREGICDYMAKRKDVTYSPAEVVVSAGAKQGLFEVAMALCRPGDEVIVVAPYWVSYSEIAQLAGAKVVTIATRMEDDFCLRPEALRAALTVATRMIILCNPCNPSGAVIDAATLDQIAEVLQLPEFRHVWVVSDEVYEQLVYDSCEAKSFAAVQGMRNRTITVNSFSKSWAMTGLRVAWIACPAPLAAAVSKLQSQMTSCPSSISQRAALGALDTPTEHQAACVAAMQSKRDAIMAWLDKMPQGGLPYSRPRGAFYIFPDVSAWFGARTGNGSMIWSVEDFCATLLEDTGVCIVPGTAFGVPTNVRISYSTGIEQIDKGMQLMHDWLAALQPPGSNSSPVPSV